MQTPYKDIDEAWEDVIRHGGSADIIWHRVRAGDVPTDYTPTRHVDSMDWCSGFDAGCADGTRVSFEGTEKRSIGSLSSAHPSIPGQRCIEATGRDVRGLPERK